MGKFNLLLSVLLFADVTSKFCLASTASPVSQEKEEKPRKKKGDPKKHFAFDLAHLLTQVSGISLKIDGLIDLGPKWNFEYTFAPFDTNNPNIGRQGPEIEDSDTKHVTTTTAATHMDTERATTKKKCRHKLRTGEDVEKSEKPPENSPKKKKPLPEKPTEKRIKLVENSAEKWEYNPETSDEAQRLSEKPLEKQEEYSKGKSKKHTNSGRSEKHRKPEKSSEYRWKANKEKATTKKELPKFSGTTPDFIYKHADNKSLILRSPHKVQEDTRLRDFTVHVYKQALRIFEDLRKKFNDTKSFNQIDKLIRDYREKFAEFVNETQYVMVKTRLGTQKVILNTMESSNMILRKLVDHLVADTGQRPVLRNEVKGVPGLLQAQLEKEMDVEYKHVCSKFGICRSQYLFSNFLAEVIGEMIKVNNKKMQIASDSLTEVIKDQNLLKYLQPKVEKRFRHDVGNAEKMNPDQMRAVLQIFRGILVNKNKPLPIMGEMDPQLMNRSLALLDLIDLFDEKIPPNEENKLAWTDIKASCKDWADGNRDDVAEIMDAFVRHIIKSGLDKFDAPTTKLLNEKFKVFYDMKRMKR